MAVNQTPVCEFSLTVCRPGMTVVGKPINAHQRFNRLRILILSQMKMHFFFLDNDGPMKFNVLTILFFLFRIFIDRLPRIFFFQFLTTPPPKKKD